MVFDITVIKKEKDPFTKVIVCRSLDCILGYDIRFTNTDLLYKSNRKLVILFWKVLSIVVGIRSRVLMAVRKAVYGY